MRPYCTGELSGYPIPPTPLAAQLLERGRLPRRPLAFPPTRFSHPNRGIKSSPRIVCTQGPICGGRLRFVERCCKLATDQGGGKRPASGQFKFPSRTTIALIAPSQRGRALQLAAAGVVRAIFSGILLLDMQHRQRRQLRPVAE